MGDFFVHNVQFYDYKPVPINALSYDPLTEQLAVGFKNGSVCVFNARQDYYQTQFVPPSVLTSVEALCWLNGRLFSCGMTGYVSEVNARMGTLVRQVPTYGMGAWCMSSSKCGSRLAVGTEAGAVSLYKLDEISGELEYAESLQRAPSRILSISWSSFDANFIATAGVGFIALLDLRHGLVQKEFPTKPETAVVWDVTFLTADVLASADSTGHVVLWSIASGGVVQRFSSHRSHVLCLTTLDGSLFASGVDAVVRRYDQKASGEWFEATLFRRHTHDVRALAISPQGLVTGGEEGRVRIFPLNRSAAGVQEGRRGQWALPFLQPRHPHIASLSKATKADSGANVAPVCVLQYPDRLEVLRLGAAAGSTSTFGKRRRRQMAEDSQTHMALAVQPKKLLVVTPKKEENIVCSAISDNAEWLAYSSTHTFRLFATKFEESAGVKEALFLSRKALDHASPRPCRLLAFTAASLLVSVQASDGKVAVLDCASGALRHSFVPSNENYSSPCSHLLTCGGPNGDLIALGCLDGHVYVYSASSGARVAQLPLRRARKATAKAAPLIPIAVALDPRHPRVLALYTDHRFLEFDFGEEEAEAACLGSGWFARFNKRAPYVWMRAPHFDWLSYIDGRRVLVANARHLVVLDMSVKVSKALRNALLSEDSGSAAVRPKRARKDVDCDEARGEAAEDALCMRSSDRFQFMLHVEVLSKTELAVLNLTPDNYGLSLPPTFQRKRFGI